MRVSRREQKGDNSLKEPKEGKPKGDLKTSITTDADLWWRFKARAVIEERRQIREVLEDALADYLRKPVRVRR